MLLKVPPETLAVHVTAPDGADAVPVLVSVTVAVKVMAKPAVDEAGFGDTVLLLLLLSTISVDVPALLECVVSPE